MKPEQKPSPEKRKRLVVRDYLLLLATIIVVAVLFYYYPVAGERGVSTARAYLVEMMTILPAVMVLMGLFQVWLPRELITRYLGRDSGLKGFLMSLGFGMLPTGPLYVAFPIAALLLEKGAKTSNVAVFLSAWACIKLPQELVELQFLGPKFMIARLLLTIPIIGIMGIALEKLLQ